MFLCVCVCLDGAHVIIYYNCSVLYGTHAKKKRYCRAIVVKGGWVCVCVCYATTIKPHQHTHTHAHSKTTISAVRRGFYTLSRTHTHTPKKRGRIIPLAKRASPGRARPNPWLYFNAHWGTRFDLIINSKRGPTDSLTHAHNVASARTFNEHYRNAERRLRAIIYLLAFVHGPFRGGGRDGVAHFFVEKASIVWYSA